MEDNTDDLIAGNAFRDSIIPRADSWNGPVPSWHGWAIMDAFLAGVEYQKSKAAKMSDEALGEKR